MNSATNACNVNNNGNANNNNASNSNGVRPISPVRLRRSNWSEVRTKGKYILSPGKGANIANNRNVRIRPMAGRKLFFMSVLNSDMLGWNSLPDMNGTAYQWDCLGELQHHSIIADANVLYDAMLASRKNTAWKCSVQKFCWNYLQRLSALQQGLDNLEYDRENAYEPKPGYEFFVNERGRVRPITGQIVDDRVVSHALNDAVLLPAIKPYLIYDNTASLKNRGLDMARRRFRAHLQKFFQREGTNKGYIRLKDQSKYYDNILLKQAYDILCSFTDDVLARKLVGILIKQNRLDVSYMTDDEYARCMEIKFDRVAYRLAGHQMEGKRFMYKGVNVGDQLSQTIGIVYPHRVDNLAKIVLGSQYYARYMDDSEDMDISKEALIERGKKIDAAAESIGMFTNTRKTCVTRLYNYFVFLQHKIRLLDNGSIDERIKPAALTRIRRRLRKLKAKVDDGIVPVEDIVNLYKSWVSERREFMSYPQLRSLELMMERIYGRNVYEQIYDHDVKWRCA